MILRDSFKVESYKAFDLFLAQLGRRDHYIHQFEVFLLGCFFLRYLHPTHSKCSKIALKMDDPILQAWLYASTSHDFGYPLQSADALLSDLGSRYRSFGLPVVADKIIGIQLSNYEEGLECLESLEAVKLVENSLILTLGISSIKANAIISKLRTNKSHGYASALLLCKVAPELNWIACPMGHSSSSMLMLCAGAVVTHDITTALFDEFDLHVEYSNNPVAYILFIVDCIQDWSRYVPVEPRWPDYHLSAVYSDLTDVNFDFILTDRWWGAKMHSDVIEGINGKKKRLEHIQRKANDSNVSLNLNYKSNDNLLKTTLKIAL